MTPFHLILALKITHACLIQLERERESNEGLLASNECKSINKKESSIEQAGLLWGRERDWIPFTSSKFARFLWQVNQKAALFHFFYIMCKGTHALMVLPTCEVINSNGVL